MAKAEKKPVLTVVADPTNGGEEAISFEMPYTLRVTIRGSCPLIYHGWNNEAVEEKGRAGKNSKAKKTDNIESYVYRNDKGELCMPGTYLRGAMINAARFRQDPRSPRKSAMDLMKSAIVPLTELATHGVKTWDYIDRSRVVVQRSAITRHRPALNAGWTATFDMMIAVPEHCSPDDMRSLVEQAGRLIGVGDHRPSYGRFGIIGFEVLSEQPAS